MADLHPEEVEVYIYHYSAASFIGTCVVDGLHLTETPIYLGDEMKKLRTKITEIVNVNNNRTPENVRLLSLTLIGDKVKVVKQPDGSYDVAY